MEAGGSNFPAVTCQPQRPAGCKHRAGTEGAAAAWGGDYKAPIGSLIGCLMGCCASFDHFRYYFYTNSLQIIPR